MSGHIQHSVRDNGSKDIKIYVNGKLETINSYTIEPSTSNSEKLIIGSGKYYSDTVEDFSTRLYR